MLINLHNKFIRSAWIDSTVLSLSSFALSQTKASTWLNIPMTPQGLVLCTAVNILALTAGKLIGNTEDTSTNYVYRLSRSIIMLGGSSALLSLCARPIAEYLGVVLSTYTIAQLAAFHAVIKTVIYAVYHFFGDIKIANIEDLNKLSAATAGKYKIHFDRNSELWDKLGLQKQIAFNTFFKKHKHSIIAFTALDPETTLSSEELEVFQEFVGDKPTIDEAKILFKNNVAVPANVDVLPGPAPSSVIVSDLSPQQITWYHKAFEKQTPCLSVTQYATFARAFYDQNLKQPSEKFIFTPPTFIKMANITSIQALYIFSYYKQNIKTLRDLPPEQQIVINQIARKAGKIPFSLTEPKEDALTPQSWPTVKTVTALSLGVICISALYWIGASSLGLPSTSLGLPSNGGFNIPKFRVSPDDFLTEKPMTRLTIDTSYIDTPCLEASYLSLQSDKPSDNNTMSFKSEDLTTSETQYVPYTNSVRSAIYSLYISVLDCISDSYNFIYPKNAITGRREFWYLPTEVEVAIGRTLYNSTCTSLGGRFANQTMQSRIKNIVTKISTHAQRPGYEFKYHAMVINSNCVNAWAMPGGNLAFHKGLIDKIDAFDLSQYKGLTQDDVLAAVVAHEVAHAAIGHTRKRLEKTLLINVALHIGKTIATNTFIDRKEPHEVHGESREELERRERNHKLIELVFDYLVQWAKDLYILMDSRNNEYEADKYGIEFMYKAGFDVRGSLALQELFIEMNGGYSNQTSTWLGNLLKWISTHPPSKDRLDANQKTVDAIERKYGHTKKTIEV